MNIEVWTDGSATTKDKPGGYGWIIVVDGKGHMEGSGSIPKATNNDAELEAAIIGLGNVLYEWNAGRLGGSKIESLGTITLVSDSQIILGWANGSYRFKQESKIKKFIQLQYLVDRLKAKTRWVEGHTGVEFNERCDKLAGEARDKAMGVERKPRKSSKPLKEACKNMAEALELVKLELFKLDDIFPHSVLEKIDKALDFYKEKVK